MSTPDTDTSKPNRTRHTGLYALGVVVLLGGIGYFMYWLLDASFYESTDDAYVNGDVVQITSEVPGTVLALHIDDTQTVKAGQPLLELDPADAQIAEANAEADLARAVMPSPRAVSSRRRTTGANPAAPADFAHGGSGSQKTHRFAERCWLVRRPSGAPAAVAAE